VCVEVDKTKSKIEKKRKYIDEKGENRLETQVVVDIVQIVCEGGGVVSLFAVSRVLSEKRIL
jgi:hypothetical protein